MGNTKKCKFCQTDIPKKAKVCPNCKKTIKGQGCLIFGVFFILLFFVIAIMGINRELKKEDASSTEEVISENAETFYKPAVEEYITTYLGLSNPEYSFSNYREWDDGAGFIMVENTYEVNDIEHSYVARVGKDNVIYKLTIDGEVLFSADTDALIEYMDNYGE